MDLDANYITVDYEKKALIVPNNVMTIGVVGDNNSRRIYFKIKRVQDELDFSLSSIKIAFTNADGNSGLQDADEITYDEDFVYFSFLIPASLTVKTGDVYVGICGSVEGAKHWHISPYKFAIGKFITISEVPAEDPKYHYLNGLVERVEKAIEEVGDLSNLKIDYDELSKKVNVPTKVSQLANDADYQSRDDVQNILTADIVEITQEELNAIWAML